MGPSLDVLRPVIILLPRDRLMEVEWVESEDIVPVKVDIMGCLVDNLTMEETLSRVEEFIRNGKPHQHVVVNVDKIVKCNRDRKLRAIVNGCDLVNADGMPVVWASKLLGKPLKQRIAGIDLFLTLVERSEQRGWRPFFLGARENVVSKVIRIFRKKYPALKIVGYRNGYWNSEEEGEVVQQIRSLKPDILFVAISSPKKEKFLERHLRDINVPFAMGVGGAFDVVAGLTKRAPLGMQKIGLEWFYRFLQEPTRMFRRYFIDDTYFFWLLAREIMRGKNSTRS